MNELAQIDKRNGNLVEKAREVFLSQGVTLECAIELFLCQCVVDGGMPFEPKGPNEDFLNKTMRRK